MENKITVKFTESEMQFLQEIIHLFEQKAGFNRELLPIEGQSLIEKIERITV